MFFYHNLIQYLVVIMLELSPQELVNAERLNNEGKVDEALNIINSLEKEGDLLFRN